MHIDTIKIDYHPPHLSGSTQARAQFNERRPLIERIYIRGVDYDIARFDIICCFPFVQKFGKFSMQTTIYPHALQLLSINNEFDHLSFHSLN